MFQRVLQDIIGAYGLAVGQIGSVQKGYRNESYRLELKSGETVNLICYKPEPGIEDRVKRADRVARHASLRGLPVRTRYDERLLRLRSNTLAGLYHYLPGHTIAWESYTQKHLKLLGWAMSDLHASLNDMELDSPYRLQDELRQLNTRMRRYFDDPEVTEAVRTKLGLDIRTDLWGKFGRLINHLSEVEHQQYLHMDMVRGNVLFDKPKPADKWQIDDLALSGVIDFEKASYGPQECDIARTLAFLLVDCTKPPDKIINYYLNSGYIKRGNGQLHYKELISPFVRFFLVYDFYKFLKHTPYESLSQNKHYIRTREILLEYGMISSIERGTR